MRITWIKCNPEARASESKVCNQNHPILLNTRKKLMQVVCRPNLEKFDLLLYISLIMAISANYHFSDNFRELRDKEINHQTDLNTC